MSNQKKNPLSILSADERRWFATWLSKPQMLEGLKSRQQAFDVLEAARSRVEQGYPPYGKLWEMPSEEENQKSIEALNERVKGYRY